MRIVYDFGIIFKFPIIFGYPIEFTIVLFFYNMGTDTFATILLMNLYCPQLKKEKNKIIKYNSNCKTKTTCTG